MTNKILSLEIFKGIDQSTVKNILENSEERNITAGQIILSEGSPSNGEGYIIKSGSVEVSINGKKVADLTQGDIFGEIALLNEEDRTATVDASTDTTLIIITLDHLFEMINNGSDINETVINRIEENLKFED